MISDEWPKLINRALDFLLKNERFTRIWRWMSGWRGDNLVSDGISWRYRHRKRYFEGLSPFCVNCECALRVGYANINDRKPHRCWMCPRCKNYFNEAEASELTSRARSKIERSLAAPDECRR